jgi:hypothetical protein
VRSRIENPEVARDERNSFGPDPNANSKSSSTLESQLTVCRGRSAQHFGPGVTASDRLSRPGECHQRLGRPPILATRFLVARRTDRPNPFLER